MNVLLSFDRTEEGAADTSGIPVYEKYGLFMDTFMQDYEWSTLTIEIPSEYAGTYLGKILLQFDAKEIAVRAISIEANLEGANE